MAGMLLFATDIFFAASKRRSYRQEVIMMFRTLIDFLQDNGLTTRTILPPDAEVTENLKVYKCDLTEEGFEFYKRVEPKWAGAIDRGKSPTDTSILERELRRLRAGG